MCKVPFSVEKAGGGTTWDLTRILEKIIVTVFAALIIGGGSWFMVFQDMRKDQEIIKKDMVSHISVTDKRHNEFVKHNTEDHKRIMDDNKVMYNHMMDRLEDMKQGLHAIRDDFYVPRNGKQQR